ncbi:MAG: M20 family metallopeptidase [Candidatus Bathyarchaeia archaeon]
MVSSSSIIHDILTRVEKSKSELISTTSNLIKFQTISPPSNTRECAEYVKSYFEAAGIETSLYAKEKSKVNVHARVPGGSCKTIVWLGHIDVVPEGMREKWIHDPFGGTIDGEKIYGRGASDMKGSCAAAMIAAKILGEIKEKNQATVDFWFTCDEEVGSPDGTRWLIEKGLIKGDACLIGDSLSRNPSKEPYIDVGCKGYLRLRLKATGRTAHGSMPFYGDNAIEKLLPAVEQIKKISSYPISLPEDLQGPIESSIKYLLSGGELSDKQKYAIKRAFHNPTVSLTMISGGVKINVIPDYAEASFDIRISPGVNPEAIAEQIRKLISGFKDGGVEAEITGLEGGYYERWDSNFAVSVRKAVKTVTNIEPQPKILLGATDAIPVKKALGVPCLGFGAGIEELAHAPNEYVTVDGLMSAAKVYAILPLLF